MLVLDVSDQTDKAALKRLLGSLYLVALMLWTDMFAHNMVENLLVKPLRYVCMYIHVGMYVYIRMYLHTYVCIYMYTSVHTCRDLHIYIYIYIYIYI